MNDLDKNEAAAQLMHFLDFLTKGEQYISEIESKPFEEVTPDFWEHVQDIMPGFKKLIEMQKGAVKTGARILEDDEAFNHAVRLAHQRMEEDGTA